MGRRLYVGNLPYKATDEDLMTLFSSVGDVASARVMRDMATGRARGFGFVEMTTDEAAQKAIAEFHQFQMDGRALVVNEARPKPEFGGGGGGGRDRGDRGGRGGGGNHDRREAGDGETEMAHELQGSEFQPWIGSERARRPVLEGRARAETPPFPLRVQPPFCGGCPGCGEGVAGGRIAPCIIALQVAII